MATPRNNRGQFADGATGSHGQRYRKKRCRSCGELKLIYEFQKSKRTTDGFTTQCKVCLNVPRKNREDQQRMEAEVRALALKDLCRNHRTELDRLLKHYGAKVAKG